jgi:formiminotetrahydrofolate cyclodeaminase
VVSVDDYLAALASEEPTPGGGSASTLIAAAAAALIAMVARITSKSPKGADRQAFCESLIEKADTLRKRLMEARAEDERAFAAVMEALKLPKSDDAEKTARSDALQASLTSAATVPLQGATIALEVLELCRRALDLEAANLVSDLACAGEFAYAALRGLTYNVRVNHRLLKNKKLVAEQDEALTRYERAAENLLKAIRYSVTHVLT